MPEWASELLRYGPLGAFALAVCWGGWILLKTGGTKAYMLGERYVISTEALHDTLKESDKQQKELCEGHANAVESLDTSMAASLVIQQEACQHLRSLVVTGSVVTENQADLHKMKAVMIQACHMCRVVAAKEFPDSAAKVSEHCAEIERIIGQASGK